MQLPLSLILASSYTIVCYDNSTTCIYTYVDICTYIYLDIELRTLCMCFQKLATCMQVPLSLNIVLNYIRNLTLDLPLVQLHIYMYYVTLYTRLIQKIRTQLPLSLILASSYTIVCCDTPQRACVRIYRYLRTWILSYMHVFSSLIQKQLLRMTQPQYCIELYHLTLPVSYVHTYVYMYVCDCIHASHSKIRSYVRIYIYTTQLILYVYHRVTLLYAEATPQSVCTS